jgi:parvulin-like peptidyl-prolyl isomerase
MSSVRFAYFFILFFCVWLSIQGHAVPKLADRILAVVNNKIITLSDARKYQVLFGEGRDEKAILEELIDQKLLLAEAEKFGVQEPSQEKTDAAYQELIRRLQEKEDGSFQPMALDEAEIRQLLKAHLMVQELLNQRVNFFVFVTPEEVETYYEGHAEEFSGTSLEQARSKIEDLLTRQKAEAKRKDYLDRLRSRATIRVN